MEELSMKAAALRTWESNLTRGTIKADRSVLTEPNKALCAQSCFRQRVEEGNNGRFEAPCHPEESLATSFFCSTM